MVVVVVVAVAVAVAVVKGTAFSNQPSKLSTNQHFAPEQKKHSPGMCFSMKDLDLFLR